MKNSVDNMKRRSRPLRVAISLLTGLALSGVSLIAGADDPVTPKAWTSSPHVFSVDDVQSGFDGNTAADDPSFLCATPGCPGDLEGPPDNRGWYAIDSEFGFYVTDFVGAETKELDSLYGEGYVSNVVTGGPPAGIAVSNGKTDTFKVPYPRGTWCAGLGGVSNKCSTENYAVLEHVLTCFETLPYRYATEEAIPVAEGDPVQDGPWTNLVELDEGITCADAQLDNQLFMVDGLGISTTQLYPDEEGFPKMPANESTVLEDVAVGLNKDYAVTRKDDGKALFRFGNLVKRPNDIRMIAKMALPQEWKDNPGVAFKVTRAELTINHQVTNNPNDQIRPEDMENESATGLKPRRIVTPVGEDELWTSAVNCYEGDGDYIPMGTVLKHPQVINVLNTGSSTLDLATLYVTSSTTVPEPPLPAGGFPYAFSGDLRTGYTNAWATSTDRDPFEWTDGTLAGVSAHEGITPGEVTTITGPRWRLLPNKFGQDIPGLEIPGCGDLDPLSCDNSVPRCIAVPFTSAFIKYEVGEPATTVINLLDWDDVNENTLQDDSPLATSVGWMDASQNIQNWTAPAGGELVCQGEGEDTFCSDAPNGISINGAVLTDDFDVVLYIKGDRKPTELYDMSLYIEYVGFGEPEPPAPVLDAYPTSLNVLPKRGGVTYAGSTAKVNVSVKNDDTSELAAVGTVNVKGVYDGSATVAYDTTWPINLPAGGTATFYGQWLAPESGTMTWTATVTVNDETVTDNNVITTPYTVQ